MSLNIALAGNPNCGKTTLFNVLTGSNQFVGNWPGVTVEKKEGRLKGAEDIIVTDLPGIYSLSPYSPEEVVARTALIDHAPDVIVNVIDGTSLERSIFLTTQLAEIGIPMVVAINMMDAVAKSGDTIHLEVLSRVFGCEVVSLSATKGFGVDDVVKAALLAAKDGKIAPRHYFAGIIEHTLAHIEEAILHDMPEVQQRWYAIKLFERDRKVIEKLHIDTNTLSHIEKDIKECERELDDDSESIITSARYSYIDSIIEHCVDRKRKDKITRSDKIDAIVTNRFLALPIFAMVMFLVYFVSVSTLGSIGSDWMLQGVFGESWSFWGISIPGIPILLQNFLEAIHCAPWLQSLILDGMVSGVGAVLGFLPQMLMLFLFLAALEACGYMSRIAFILDRVFRRFGLSGKSFIPILIGTGCGVPGIMASRTIENEKDRRMTIITTTFIPCGAKLPIISMMASALFHDAWWVAPSAYFIGIAAILCSGLLLKKTKLFASDEAPFMMELPSYHMPTLRNVLQNMWDRGWSFLKKAGTIILLASMVIWFASHFGWSHTGFGMVEMSNSLLARIGTAIAWIFVPLGWGDWQSAVATLTGLAAKENVVSTFGVLFQGSQTASQGLSAIPTLSTHFSILSGYSFLIFNLLCAPCVAAIGAIRKEMNHRGWFFFAIGYQCGFAYFISLLWFQFGSLFVGSFTGWTLLALVLFAGFLFGLFRRPSRGYQMTKNAREL
ncbi:MAG: ferrous iron transport protein B [Lachnospiraceae bacterium]|jgi:ferrous iron transport protein B|nr:ferrous iron transport protein B [Lachnospiraceae bacterium]